MIDIEMHEVSADFEQCWQSAGLHLQKHFQDPLRSWLRAHLNPPFLEHLSFRLGNQLFFIRIEDIDGVMKVPGSRRGLLSIAEGCHGHPCLMPMRGSGGTWTPEISGSGLLDVRTGQAIDPIALVSKEPIEMTDWELQDFAVQIVRDHLEKAGRKLMSWQGNPAVDPAIWLVGECGPEWVVVRAVRYPNAAAEQPANWSQIAERCARIGSIGHFASVAIANADDPFHNSMPPLPLLRGHALTVRFDGLARGRQA